MSAFASPELNLFSEDARRNPYPLYQKLRAASPVLPVPQLNFWMLFDYDSVKRALNDHDAFSSSMSTAGRGNPDWFFFMDQPRHTRQRALITRAFTPRVVANLEPRIAAISAGLLDAVQERRDIDLVADFSTPLPAMVIAEMLGIPAEDRPRLNRWIDVMLGLIFSVTGGPEAAAATQQYRAATEEMSGWLADLIARRSTAPQDDLLTALAQAEVDSERLTHREILNFVQLLLVAGTETTTNLIANAMICFLDHPEQLDRLRREPALLSSAIEEVLRYRGPAQWLFRATRCDVEIHGVAIPAGKLVLPVVGSANRDPQVFADADRFDIARDPNPHIAFGHGIHFCIGAALSRLETRVALSQILERWVSFELASAEPWPPRRPLHVHGPSRLNIRFRAE
jgi:cytochrome P450